MSKASEQILLKKDTKMILKSIKRCSISFINEKYNFKITQGTHWLDRQKFKRWTTLLKENLMTIANKSTDAFEPEILLLGI